MRNCEVINLKDGEGELCVSLLWCLATSFSGLHGSTPVNNAWKMNNVKKNKWYVLYTRTPEEKSKWIKAFAEEKARIEEDEETGRKSHGTCVDYRYAFVSFEAFL